MSIGEAGPDEVLKGDAGVEGAEIATDRGSGGDQPDSGDPQLGEARTAEIAGGGLTADADGAVPGSGEAVAGPGMVLPDVQPVTLGRMPRHERQRPRWLLPAAALAAAVAVATVVVIALPHSGSKPVTAHLSQGGKIPTTAPSRSGGAQHSSPGNSNGLGLPAMPPSPEGVTHNGIDPETIVARSDGSVVTYQWLPGGAAVAEYVQAPNGVVVERAWNSNGTVAGNYRLSCSGPNVMDSQEIGSGRWTPPFSVGSVANACANGLTPLAYARGFATSNQTAFYVQQAA
ncbi:MAG TPA: hypothetical protein VGS28_00680 [Candidatus Saccharimonadales bacterium]|nr:hypothetical protein [Candidatus Saccharimonadales bacterium]